MEQTAGDLTLVVMAALVLVEISTYTVAVVVRTEIKDKLKVVKDTMVVLNHLVTTAVTTILTMVKDMLHLVLAVAENVLLTLAAVMVVVVCA